VPKKIGAAGFEPAAFWSQRRERRVDKDRSGSQPVVNVANVRSASATGVQPLAPVSKDFAAKFAAKPLSAAGLLPDALLSVRQVAARVGLSTASVYALCESGALRSLRISNSIRIEPAEFARFIAEARKKRT
jgi:excisionase family DNA binding protein